MLCLQLYTFLIYRVPQLWGTEPANNHIVACKLARMLWRYRRQNPSNWPAIFSNPNFYQGSRFHTNEQFLYLHKLLTMPMLLILHTSSSAGVIARYSVKTVWVNNLGFWLFQLNTGWTFRAWLCIDLNYCILPITLEVSMALRKREPHHASYIPVTHRGAWGTQKEKLWPTRGERWFVFILSLWEVILVRHPLGEPAPLWSVTLYTHASFFVTYLPF